MGIDPMVSMAVNMKQQALRDNVNMGVMKMALDQMQQSGQDVLEMMDDGGASAPNVSLDPALGGLLDISI